MRSESVKNLVFSAVVAALYAAITIALAPISYGPIQFRLSEILVLLAFVNRKYIPGLVLGCLLANMYSQLGIMDVVFGTLATYISVELIARTKNLFMASLWPVVVNGVIIGIMLNMLYSLPLLLTIGQVAFGEFVVVSIAGVILFKTAILNNSKLMELLNNNY